MMGLIRVFLMLGVFVLIVYVTYTMIRGAPTRQITAPPAGARWVAAHYAMSESTRVVVRKMSLGNDNVLDEHMVAEIPDSDPDFDTKFLEAMAEARARAALFESESD